jgi:hypothetical protein
MSHHLDTPLAAQNGQLFIDDLYVFSVADSTVFIKDVNSNITGVHVKPGFHHEARYEFKIHFDGADFETLTYRISFDEAGPDGRQGMKLHVLIGWTRARILRLAICWCKAGRAKRLAPAGRGCGLDVSRIHSTSTYPFWRKSTGR